MASGRRGGAKAASDAVAHHGSDVVLGEADHVVPIPTDLQMIGGRFVSNGEPGRQIGGAEDGALQGDPHRPLVVEGPCSGERLGQLFAEPGEQQSVFSARRAPMIEIKPEDHGARTGLDGYGDARQVGGVCRRPVWRAAVIAARMSAPKATQEHPPVISSIWTAPARAGPTRRTA